MRKAGDEGRPRRRYFHRWFGYVVIALVFFGGGAYAAVAYLSGQSYSFHDDGLLIVRRPMAATPTPSPSTGPAPLAPYDQSIRQQDLDKVFRPLVQGASAPKAQVVYAELNGDRVEDALVSLHIDGSGGYVDAAVYTMVSGTLKQLWRLPVADKLASAQVDLGANQSIVYIGAKTYDSANTRIDTTYSYIWNTSMSAFAKAQ